MRRKPFQSNKPHHLMALFGLLGGVILGVLLQGVYTYWQSNIIIAPYYKKEAFKEPKLKLRVTPAPSLRTVNVPVIMYHYVEYVEDENDLIRKSLTINPSMFRSHLHDLAEAGYSTYYVKDIPAMISGELVPDKKSVILTFDDGYEDFYTDALPLLKKYHMKATLYVIYNYIGRHDFLKDWQIREIIKSGLVEIGSHTFDHAYLKGVPVNYAQHQIADSKDAFEKDYGITIESFAYPYGAFDEQAVDVVEKAGYAAAVAVIAGTEFSSESLYYLPRLRAGILGYDSVSALNKYIK